MSVFKHAILYLTRKKSRAVILLLAFFVLSIFSMIFLSISSAVSQELKNLETSLASSFTYKVNSERYRAAVHARVPPEELEYISDSELKTIQLLEGVEYCYTHFTPYWLIWADIDTGDTYYMELNESEDLPPNERQNNIYMSQTLSGDCFFGCYNSDMHEYFRTGAFQLIEGRHI